MHNNKTAVYTAIFSDNGYYQHDSLKENMNFDQDNVDFICFTNNRYIVSDKWDVRYVNDLIDNSGRKTARYYKTMAHEVLPEYKDWIWLDGSHSMRTTVREFKDEFGLDQEGEYKSQLVAAPHPDRKCIYDEAKICIRRELDDPEIIKKQMEYYRDKGYPERFGLIESSILFRVNHDINIALNELWWKLINEFSIRDQLSFNFAIWEMNNNDDYPVSQYGYQLLDGCICLQEPSLDYGKSRFFQSSPHINKEWTPLAKIFRISDAGYEKDKLPISEIECLKNFIDVFGTNDLYVLADKCSQKTKDALDNIPNLYWKEIEGGSSAGSWRVARDFALDKFDDETIIYFIEDDYLHLEKSPRLILEGLNEGAGYVTLYDHPDKYINASEGGNPQVKGGGEVTRVFMSEHSHWKLTNSTTMTFACKLKTLKDDMDVWDKHTGGSHPNDYQAFLDIRKKGRSLASPIPGYSTHIERRWLTPLRNWEEYVR